MNTTHAAEPTSGNDLTGKAFLITGGSTGIGFATAELLVRDGARVFLTGRNQQSLDAAQHRLASMQSLFNPTPLTQKHPENWCRRFARM